MEQKILSSDEDVVIKDAVAEYLIDCRIRNLRPRTLEWYSDRLEAILEPYWNELLSSLDITTVREITAGLMTGRKVPTINGYLRALRAFLNWALVEGLKIGVDPRRIRNLREPKRLKPILTEEEIIRVLQMPDRQRFVGGRDYVILLVLFDTGVRNSELCNLDVADVDLPIIRVIGKGDKMRLVSLSPTVQREMMRYLRERRRQFGPEGPLFPNSITGMRLNRHRLKEIVRTYGDMAGIEFGLHPHACRYAFATHYLRNGGQVERLMISLGHTSITMSLHYARLADVDALANAMEFSPIAKISDTQGRGGAKRRDSHEQVPETRTERRKRHR